VHGEPQAQLALQEKMRESEMQVEIAAMGQTITL
jgi:hypothetical protein